MCGRFTLNTDGDIVQEVLEIGRVPEEATPRYNIAPTQNVAVVTDPESRDVEMFRWGLIPSWAKDLSMGSRLINARSETVAEKPSFRSAFKRRRCLVLADGFYEWQKGTGPKGRSQPFHFRLASGDPFAFAGLWEIWRPQEEADPLLTCTIITGPANEVVAPVHGRSPIVLTGERMWRWMDGDASREELRNLLMPLPAEMLDGYPVATLVNSPAADSPELIEPISL